MISHAANALALRNHARALVVTTTGSVTLGVTANSYTRSTGSFLTDGFELGMEITASGFTGNNNGTAVITAVTDTTMTVNKTLTVAAPAAGKTLSVGLPSKRAWENITTSPTTGAPYVEEQYIPGPLAKVTLGPLGELEALPQYALLVNVPSNTGPEAAYAYADAIIRQFAPGTPITLPNGDVLKVRTDAGPYSTQLRQGNPGWAVVPVVIPLRLRSQNAI